MSEDIRKAAELVGLGRPRHKRLDYEKIIAKHCVGKDEHAAALKGAYLEGLEDVALIIGGAEADDLWKMSNAKASLDKEED